MLKGENRSGGASNEDLGIRKLFSTASAQGSFEVGILGFPALLTGGGTGDGFKEGSLSDTCGFRGSEVGSGTARDCRIGALRDGTAEVRNCNFLVGDPDREFPRGLPLLEPPR